MHSHKHRWQLLGAIGALLLGGAVARAQTAAPTGPSPELRKLEFLVGQWTGTGKIGLNGPTPGTISATRRIDWALEGAYLRIEQEHQEAGFEGARRGSWLMLLGYEPEAKRYRGWWFFSSGGTPVEVQGSFDGTKLLLTSSDEGPQPAHAGIGVQLNPAPTTEGHPGVYRVLAGTPAARAGLKTGDLILRADGRSTAGMKVSELVELLRGPADSTVRLTVRSAGQEREVTLTRETITPPPVSMRLTWQARSKTEFSNVIEQREGGTGHYEKVVDILFTKAR